MLFYRVQSLCGTQFFDGEFSPYPDLVDLILGPDLPPQLRVEIRTGKRPGDDISASAGVYSKRFVKVLEECGATGYRSYPIEVRKGGALVPGYFLLKITGRGGPLDEERSGVSRDKGFRSYKAIYMDEAQWDGSDVFYIPGFGIGMYVVERVRDALERAKLTNLELKRNSDCHLP